MPADFNNPDTARRLRDVVDKLVLDAIDRERPRDTFGVVTAIDNDGRRCWVQFPGAPDSVPVLVGGLQPSQVGQTVRVGTLRPGVLTVVDVQGNATLTAEPSSGLPAITGLVASGGFNSLYIDWDSVAPRYEVQVADDVGMTTNVRAYPTDSSQITVGGLAEDVEYFARVRSLNASSTGAGPWSSVEAATTTIPSAEASTDGDPPDASPAPSVTAGIGMVTAEWAPATGTTDLIFYEVHVSLSSGFTPSSGTLLDETTARFSVITQLPDATPLTDHFGDNVFVRIIAKDADGSAAVSAQGFAAPRQVDTGDVGTVQVDQIRDGSAPASSPAAVLTEGVGLLLVTWLPVTNDDPVAYEVHMSTTSSFTPNVNTLSFVTPSNFGFIYNETPQIDIAEPPIDHTVTYYVQIVATDVDGVASPGTEASGSPLDPGAANNTNTATYLIDGGAAASITIGDANIVDGKITNLSAAIANIWQANIQDLAVGTAQIQDLAVDTAKIALLAVGDAQIDTLSAAKLTAGIIAAQDIVLSNSSASIIRSSNFSAGTAGWHILGDGTAEFNDVTIRGVLGANLVEGQLVTTTGGGFQTAPTAPFLRMTNTLARHIDAPSGDAGETTQGDINWTIISGRDRLKMAPAELGTAGGATGGGIYVYGRSDSGPSLVEVFADDTTLISTVTVQGTFLHVQGGSESAPSIARETDTNTGLWWEAGDELVLVAGGSAQLKVTTSGVGVPGDLDVVGSVDGASVTATGTVTGATVTSTGVLNGASVSVSGVLGGGSVSVSGVLGGASLSVSGAIGGASVSVSGTVAGATISSTGNVTTGNTGSSYMRVADGSVSAPALTSHNDTNTGLWWEAGDQLGLVAGGTRALRVTASQLLGPSGSASTPGWTFLVEPDLGMYRRASGSVGFATGGTEAFYADNTNMVVARTLYQISGEDRGLRLRDTDTSGAITKYVSFEDSGGTQDGYVGIVAGSMRMYTATNDDIIFGTNATARWVLNAAGHFTPWSHNAYDIGTSSSPRVRNIYAVLTDAAGGNSVAINANGRFQFDSSTRRFKSNIRSWEPEGGFLNAVIAMGPSLWDKIPGENRIPGPGVGGIAEDVIDVLGEIAGSFNDDGDVINYKDRAVIWALVGAVKELAARLD